MFQLGETSILAANADTLDPSLMMEEIQRLQAELHATNKARRLAEQSTHPLQLLLMSGTPPTAPFLLYVNSFLVWNYAYGYVPPIR